MRFVRAFLAELSAAVELRAAQLAEQAAGFQESQYWRGYTEGYEDARRDSVGLRLP